jgi:hypothetical protein
MSLLSIAVATLITVLPAWLWLERLVPTEGAGRRSLIAGYSVLLGLLVTSLSMQLLSVLGIALSLYSMGAIAMAMALAARFAPAHWRSPATTLPPLSPGTYSLGQKFLIALCLALIASRLLALGLEAGLRPVWSWDAKQHWTKQARVFYEMRASVPYVSLDEWLALGGKGVYTNMHPDYPIATPLLQAWTAIALGGWHSSLVNSLWPIMWLALGLIFYGQSRQAGALPHVAIAATYMMLSLPYLNIQVALAGYADLLLAVCYLAAVAALFNWSQHREAWQLYLALLAGAGCLLVKNEGFYWLLSLAPGILIVTLGVRRSVAIIAVAAVALLLLLWLLPTDLSIAGHTLESIDLKYRPESWRPIYLSTLVHDNWHFTGYLFLAALLIAPFYARRVLPLAAVMAATIVLYLALYLLTSNAYGAVAFTSLNRVALQFMPALGFFTLAVYLALSQPGANTVQLSRS